MGKVGRPPSDNPSNKKVTVRMTDSLYEQLKKYNEATGQTMTETILEGFDLLMKEKGRKV